MILRNAWYMQCRAAADSRRLLLMCPDPKPILTTELDRIAIQDALERIPPSQRLAVEMHDMAGWTVEEMSQNARVSLTCMKARLRRGRQKVRALLA